MNFRVTTQEFCMVGSYTEDLTTHRTVKIGGWALARGWALVRDNMVVAFGSFLPQICIVLEAVLLKLHVKLAPEWGLKL